MKGILDRKLAETADLSSVQSHDNGAFGLLAIEQPRQLQIGPRVIQGHAGTEIAGLNGARGQTPQEGPHRERVIGAREPDAAVVLRLAAAIIQA